MALTEVSDIAPQATIYSEGEFATDVELEDEDWDQYIPYFKLVQYMSSKYWIPTHLYVCARFGVGLRSSEYKLRWFSPATRTLS